MMIITCLLLLCVAAFCMQRCQKNDYALVNSTVSKPDTVYIDRIKADTITRIEVIERFLPRTVTIYLSDTARRKALAADTIISGLELKAGQLKLETITPRGVVMDAEFKLPPMQYTGITIDANGSLKVEVDSAAIRRDQRREKWRRVGNYALIGSAAIIGVMLGQNFK